MRPIAKRWRSGLLALAPPNGGFLGNLELHRLQAGAFVGTVAKRLLGGPTAGTPPVGSGFNFEGKGFGVTDFRFFSHIDDVDQNRRGRNPQFRQITEISLGSRRCCGCQHGGGGWRRSQRLDRRLTPGLCRQRTHPLFRVFLRGYLVKKRQHQPPGENQCGAADKVFQFHRFWNGWVTGKMDEKCKDL